ncbi:unnamed protein product [Bursaphelenchus okinawaensis]|uniref:ANK_REP_REGION domain-containing protein n=1 Tax=Bursaphelenchus okinawaensis TaxID=465554 RepID=A0A811JU56_9BILA|nr:unnamed protein product [Bursaphelenchus okinawaensis]CAG9083366.1 unnamed protein product [Bursaphelenchus okinawaensis]
MSGAIGAFLGNMNEPPDHAQLINEMPRIERLEISERLQLAQRLRRIQKQAADRREKQLPPPRPRNPRLRFSPHVALLEATSRGAFNEVQELLANGADPNSHNEDGLTPLHQCAIDRNPRIVELLLQYRADVNATDTELWTPLHAAACCGYSDIVAILIHHGADLLAVNAEGNMPYDICDEEETLDLIETEMANNGITQEYINERRSQPETKMLNDLRDLHGRQLPINVRYPDGSTYLHIAAAHGYTTVAAFLLRCGVSPFDRDNDCWMPIHAAANWNQPEIIEMLVDYGADIKAKTGNDEAPLDLATDEQTKQVIQQLLQHEARKKRMAFGVRDSRRQSRRRNKFESPQQPPSPTGQVDNPFSARGAIRRQSLRDRSGVTLARLEAQKEHTNLMKSWSKEDVSNAEDPANAPQRTQSLSDTRRDSPNKRILSKSNKTGKTYGGGNEWTKKLEADRNDDDEETGFKSTHSRGSTVRKKKKERQEMEMSSPSPTSTTALNGKPGIYGRSEKKICCCSIL